MPYSDALPGGVTLALIQTELDRRLGQEDVVIATSYPPQSVSSAGVANNFGAWVQLLATIGANPVTITEITVIPVENIDTAAHFEVEIGVGGAGAEASIGAIVGRYFAPGAPDGRYGNVTHPITGRRIAANSRVSARIRDDRPNINDYFIAIIYRQGQ